ncbi:hypothetical protein SERLA73DRAFT_107260 [Serpula lacrymans var. lacrymans S7.3]|uniref:Protein kinase domain-containing protein n=2 Tax=Serpula lacrymans var. lacrymans TaxID=341189 RepID=F8PW59_SERL3|nr:uncharacterized protein SERLADRAFT_448714 [Serpula lacrymans var. lacrymans S7.9]EGO00235.1 hypothetical protein SERLA73DRAFT_107260 [Serpula lacrymans var. lacrymans S7.3]EGO25792.1 hypothetical protein SERLADRAFT_448714 [Serpula lacrymans var. lacrymans S7.9]
MARALEDSKQNGYYSRRSDEARSLLNLLQALLDYAQLSPGVRRRFTAALIKLSTKSGCYPDCLVLEDIKKLSEDPIAAGSSGEVWKGSFRGQVIAMKILKVYERFDLDEFLKRCSNEITIWRQLSHPNLIPFYGVYHLNANKNRICLISPWMEHGSITRFLKQYPNSSRTSLMLDIARGLEYLHRRQPGIVHGDLKGENILITPSLHACLTDFGVASARGTHLLGLTTAPSMRGGGTLRWQAPELLSFETEDVRNSFSSDVYAFGCVGYEHLIVSHLAFHFVRVYSGEIPFHEMRSEYQVIQAVTKGVRPARPLPAICDARHLDDDMWRVIGHCWVSDPHTRPTVSQIVAALCQRLRLGIDSKLPTDNWDYSFMSKVSRTAEHPFSCSFLQ